MNNLNANDRAFYRLLSNAKMADDDKARRAAFLRSAEILADVHGISADTAADAEEAFLQDGAKASIFPA